MRRGEFLKPDQGGMPGGILDNGDQNNIQQSIKILSYEDFLMRVKDIAIPVHPEQCLDDFTRSLINNIELPSNPQIGRYIQMLALRANRAARYSGSEYVAEIGTNGTEFESTPLVRMDSEGGDYLFYFELAYRPGKEDFEPLIKFHNHPPKRERKKISYKYSGFSTGDARHVLEKPGLIYVLATVTDMYIATGHPQTYIEDGSWGKYFGYGTDLDYFPSDFEQQELTWTDEEREQNIADLFHKYKIHYYKYSLDKPNEPIMLA